MSVKLRLRRQGRKGAPYYHIIAADSHSPRDGKYLEAMGHYDPTKSPAIIEVDHDKALKWLKVGAQPTDTVRAILRYTGVNLKFALSKQGKDQETIDTIYNKWWAEKQAKIEAKKEKIASDKNSAAEVAHKHETSVKDARRAAIVAKNTPPAPEAPAAEVVEEAAPLSATEIAAQLGGEEKAPVAETPVVEAPKEEAPVVEAPKEETPVVEAAKEEAPVAEAPKEETPAEDAPKGE